ncbi:MAG: MATE family efflux transporter [Lewinellaceae bacterium]|nr:MATE family efflux transporter [Lewinellaceae bacterium]
MWSLLQLSLNGEEQDYTKGSIDRAIVLLSIPMILEMAMESLFAVVDAFYVSKVGIEAVATVGLTESVLTLIYSIAIGLSSAATAMVARRVGEGNRKAAATAGAQTILIAISISLLIALPGFFFAKDILRVMANDADMTEKGWRYTRLMFTANLPILLLWMVNGIFRGAGDAATAMRALWISNGINIILDPIFIFGWGPIPAMGVLGAGIATTIGRSVGVGYQFWKLFGGSKNIRLLRSDFRPQFDIIRRLLAIGAGGAGQYIIGSASWIFMIGILGRISASVVAGYTIAIRIFLFSILPAWGLANAAATLVGQNLGAGHPERAEKSTVRTGFFAVVFMGTVGIIYLITAPWLVSLFNTDPEVVRAGSLALRIIGGGYIFFGYGMVLLQSLNGAGDTRTPTILNFFCFWLLEIPLAWLLALHFNWGQTGVYWSIVIAESVLAIAAIVVFRQGKWKQVKV